ncbi:Putative ribosome biogenesis protein Nop53/GLTSCR2 [Septoria linicola]|uniref:Ribosome biogenesis protein NOP53 n=1 Tax=Septoria linicola TaxID=215465 RepID=A0A9Q9AX17_9PEZI|nr:putative ribosome biogenesis protein Nop53/GLTSCR2 [Septoria linicola]USW57004.1 Putative ribosome biogenesis protein Nop53/GLTSCR2 [Septoria linicola]
MADDKNTVAPATYSQPSRKGKKAWRKNVDISEVSSGLDNLRTEIIQGGPVAEKTADELFATDITGDAEIDRKQKSKKLLKVDEILAARNSKVDPLQPGRKRKAEDHSGSGVDGKRVKANGKYVSHKELARLRNVADGRSVGILVDDQPSDDLWGAPAPQPEEQYTFLEKKKPKVAPATIKHAPTPLTTSGKAVATVLKPAGGKSYNPLVTDWSALLEKEGAAAVEAEKARLAAEAAQAERDRIAEEHIALVEAAEKDEYATDYESAWESEWDGIQSEGEAEVHVQKQKARKTPTERNKIKARKEREAKEKWEKKQKLRDAQERRIKEIAKEVAAKERARRGVVAVVDDSSASDEEQDGLQLRKRRFGQVQVPDALLEVQLPDELQDSLRKLKPEGSLLSDSYRNKIINGKLEPRKRVGQVKQKQTQRREKWSYKDWQLK